VPTPAEDLVTDLKDAFSSFAARISEPPFARATKWFNGASDPTLGLGQIEGDYYIKHDPTNVYQFDGTAWQYQFTLGSGSSAPPPPPPAPPPGDIVDVNGAIINSAYSAMAYKLIQDEGIAYRFGAAATSSAPTLPLRADAGAINHGGNNNIYFSHGPEDTVADNKYVSIHGTAIGKPNTSTSLADAVIWFQSAAVDRVTFMQRPQFLWQDNSPRPPEIDQYVSNGELAYNNDADLPVCEYRGENAADSPSTRLSLVCTQGSPTRPARMFTTGTYTAKNMSSTQFRLGFVPTGIAVTSGGEFAFVSGWDTVNVKGQVAVVSLGSTSQGSPLNLTAPHSRYDWWHGWMDMMHPGFCDQGNWIFQKIIGYIDLPSNMKAPTSIAATTGVNAYRDFLKYDTNGISNFQMMDSPMANNRAKMLPGGEDYERYAKGGVVVVASKSERTVCFIDLGPLFIYTNDMYLGSAAKNLETQNMGYGANQWPYMLADHPEAMPTIAKTITLSKRIAAVLTTASYGYWDKDMQRRMAPPNDMYWEPDPRYPRAWVATEDGDLHVYSLGRYAAGVKPTTPTPSDIAEVGLVTGLGTNITHLAGCKAHTSTDDPLNHSVIFTDRANRKAGLVAFNNISETQVTGTVHTLIQDSRVDPIMFTQSDNYNTWFNVLSAADYSGSCIRNYRFDTAVYSAGSGATAPWSPATLLNSNGEYCGALATPFKPISVHMSNVP